MVGFLYRYTTAALKQAHRVPSVPLKRSVANLKTKLCSHCEKKL